MGEILDNRSGISEWNDASISPLPFWASRVSNSGLLNRVKNLLLPDNYTRFEQLVLSSVTEALQHTSLDIKDERVLFVLSTTKGNVELLNRDLGSNHSPERLYLWHTAELVRTYFSLAHQPIVVSNACISGVVAIDLAARYIRSGRYDHAVICGADAFSAFIFTGFNSFLSLCNGPCRPFDKDRKGLSLGEGAGTVIISNNRSLASAGKQVKIGKGFSGNDANHISGPSRTAEGLFLVIGHALEALKSPLDFISAHGTATPFNDDMESVALFRTGLDRVPVNSLKGYWGHTLGAAGIIETIATRYSMGTDTLFATKGFANSGVAHPLAVIDAHRKQPVNTCLKIASGFGGCNASLILYS